MKTLYLIRHAKSSWKNPSLSDHDRPLNKRGKRDAPFMGKKLHVRGVMPDIVVSSTAKRAKRTAQIIAKELQFPEKKIDFIHRIYDADEQDLLYIIQRQPKEAEVVLIFGHNPEFTDFTNELTNSSIENVPTTGIACIEFDVKNWEKVAFGKGKLVFFDFPKNYLAELPPK